MRAGIRLAIFGPPNVGKSSLLNFLGTMALRSHRIYADEKVAAQREAAIVTHVPGTTRDILELSLDIGGLPVLVADTAGLRDTTDEVEKIGVERARKAYVLSLNPFLLILLLVSTPSL
jgi:tRNA modification GTPase